MDDSTIDFLWQNFIPITILLIYAGKKMYTKVVSMFREYLYGNDDDETDDKHDDDDDYYGGVPIGI